MTAIETRNWGGLFATLGIFIWFIMAMTENGAVIEVESNALVLILIQMIIAFVVLTIIVAIATTVAKIMLRSGSGRSAKEIEEEVEEEMEAFDERDQMIENRASRNGYFFIAGAVNLIAISMLFDSDWTPLLSSPAWLLTPSGIFFALISVMMVATLVKIVSILFYYRRTSG